MTPIGSSPRHSLIRIPEFSDPGGGKARPAREERLFKTYQIMIEVVSKRSLLGLASQRSAKTAKSLPCVDPSDRPVKSSSRGTAETVRLMKNFSYVADLDLNALEQPVSTRIHGPPSSRRLCREPPVDDIFRKLTGQTGKSFSRSPNSPQVVCWEL